MQELVDNAELMPVVELDIRPGSDYRAQLNAITEQQYGIVSFPRSGHNWLSRMLAEIIRIHGCHDEPAAIGKTGGMGRYVGLKCQRPDQVERLQPWYHPFPVIYGSHGHESHDGFDPTTKCYLYRGFRAVWKSTRKANAEMYGKQLQKFRENYRVEPEPSEARMLKYQAGGWWGKNFLHCLVTYARHRWRFRKTPLKIRYEDLRKNPHKELWRILDHMGVHDVELDTVDAAVAAGSRKNMLREQELYGSPNPFDTVNPG